MIKWWLLVLDHLLSSVSYRFRQQHLFRLLIAVEVYTPPGRIQSRRVSTTSSSSSSPSSDTNNRTMRAYDAENQQNVDADAISIHDDSDGENEQNVLNAGEIPANNYSDGHITENHAGEIPGNDNHDSDRDITANNDGGITANNNDDFDTDITENNAGEIVEQQRGNANGIINENCDEQENVHEHAGNAGNHDTNDDQMNCDITHDGDTTAHSGAHGVHGNSVIT